MKIVNWIKSHKLIVLLGILTIVFIVYILISKKEELPTPVQGDFKVNYVLPPSGEQETAFPTTAIAFYFSQAVDPNSIKGEVAPNVKFKVSTGENDTVVYVAPNPMWKLGTAYTITLDATSIDGEPLLNSISHSFKFKTPKYSPLTE